MRLPKFIISLAILIVFQDRVPAQTYWFDNGWHEIEVSQAQVDKLEKIESNQNGKLVAMQKTQSRLQAELQMTQRKLSQLMFEFGKELEQLLTEKQLESLNNKRADSTRKNAQENAKFISSFAKFLDSVAAADSLIIYEGLPRATAVELAKLKQKNQTITLAGWEFYTSPLDPNQSIVEKLRSTLVDYAKFNGHYTGQVGKGCGGFHPDYCVQWTANNRICHALICLSCNELEYVAASKKMKFDFDEIARQSFADIAKSSFRHHANTIKKSN